MLQVGRYGPKEFDFSRERVTASVSESLKRLQVVLLPIHAGSTAGSCSACHDAAALHCAVAGHRSNVHDPSRSSPSKSLFGIFRNAFCSCPFTTQVDYIDIIQTHDIEFGDLDQVCESILSNHAVLKPDERARSERSGVYQLRYHQYPKPLMSQPHSLSLSDCIVLQVVNETIPALLALREQGLVRHIGITGLPLKIFRTVLDRYNHNKLCLQSLSITQNLGQLC